jgi:hypothetical protein
MIATLSSDYTFCKWWLLIEFWKKERLSKCMFIASFCHIFIITSISRKTCDIELTDFYKERMIRRTILSNRFVSYKKFLPRLPMQISRWSLNRLSWPGLSSLQIPEMCASNTCSTRSSTKVVLPTWEWISDLLEANYFFGWIKIHCWVGRWTY